MARRVNLVLSFARMFNTMADFKARPLTQDRQWGSYGYCGCSELLLLSLMDVQIP